MDSIQQSITEMKVMFDTKMAEFKQDLERTTPAAVSPSTLATDFASFKSFIVLSLSNLQQQVELLSRECDKFEMRSRRKILLIHGVPEEKNEDTSATVVKVATTHLKMPNLTQDVISRSHRMGRSSNNKPRPILVKFSDVAVRDKVRFSKTGLKGSGITISEFLTKLRHQTFMEARQRFGVSKCWTRDGLVVIVALDGSRHRIPSLSELNKIPSAAALNTQVPTAAETTKVQVKAKS